MSEKPAGSPLFGSLFGGLFGAAPWGGRTPAGSAAGYWAVKKLRESGGDYGQ